MNRRRRLLVALGASALPVPLFSIAQQKGNVWRIGVLWERDQSDSDSVQRLEAFKSGLRALGYTEGRDYAWRENIIELAAKHRLPAVYPSIAYIDSGGLMSYGTDQGDLYRRSAAYADKIFKGAKPGDLPIEQPTKFEFVLNMKTAKALGIRIPGSVVVQATQVIE